MAALDLRFDRIATSPSLRARQTADLVAERFGDGRGPEVWSALAPGEAAADVVASLAKLPASARDVLLVGHEPDLSQLASLWLVGDATGLALTLKKAGLIGLSATEVCAGRSARLEWLLTPRQLRRLGTVAGQKGHDSGRKRPAGRTRSRSVRD